jgi:hypothetical protein
MGMSGNTSDRHQCDPMREIDRMLLEDVMQRYKVETNATAVAFRTGALMVVLTLLAVMLGHTIAHSDRTITAAKAPHENGYSTPFGGRQLW